MRLPWMTSALPPRDAIRSLAFSLKRCACTVRALVSSPSASTLSPSPRRLTIPCFTSSSGVTMVPASNTSRRPRLTQANDLRKG
jgi:hypothetical protein